MKRKIEIKRIQVEGRKVWQWRILEGRKILFGGMCATKKDAANDAGIVWRENAEFRNAASGASGLDGGVQ